MSPEEYAHLSRPFDPAILAQAKRLAREYRLVIERSEVDEAYFIGSTFEMPGAMGGGTTIQACARDVIEATVASIATMLEKGETPPAPAREGRRDQQVNIRVSAEERARLAANAAAAGFRSISDFVRSAALGSR